MVQTLETGSDHEHCEVWQVPGHAEHCGLQVALVASQIDEGDHLARVFADFNPIQMTVVWLIHNFP